MPTKCKKARKPWSYVSYLKSAIRKIWRWSPARRACLRSKTCATCGKHKEVLADHKDPVVDPKIGFQTWDIYIRRMFEGQLQPLCKPCHKIKSNAENAIRRETRRLANG